MRAHACIIIIICTRTCFTHNAAYIVAIGLHRATTSYPSRDFSAARNIFCLNLKRTAFGNVKTTLGLVLAALQVILVPSTNVGRIAHSLIHEPFKERLLLTRLRDDEKHSKNQVSRGSFHQSRPGTTPPSRGSYPNPRASIARSIARVVDRAVVHRLLARAHTSPPPPSSPSSPSTRDATPPRGESDRRYPTPYRSRIIDRNPRAHGIVIGVVLLLHRRAPSVYHRHRTFCVFFFMGVVRFWVPPKAATTTRVVDTASIAWLRGAV